MIISTSRLDAFQACEDDIETIIEIEKDKENRDFIWQGTYEEHREEILDPNHLLWVFKSKENQEVIGYILAAIDKKSEVFELRRIAITKKGQGFGKEIMEAMLDYAFEELGMNRFWLDVYPHHKVGINLYEGLGMKCEGILRQSYKSREGYLDQKIYSILKSEYYSENN